MDLWEILVPAASNDGKSYHAKYHRVWDEKVREISRGLTVLTPAHGQWIAPDGELFVEKMIPVRVMCDEAQIHAIADFTAQYYSQRAVMFYRVADKVTIKHY